MNRAAAGDRVDFVLERILENRRSGALHEPGEAARFAHVFGVADNRRESLLPSHQGLLGRAEVSWCVHRLDSWSVSSELAEERRLVLLRGQAAREAAIDEDPAFVTVGSYHERHPRKCAALEQRARLIGQFRAVDDRPPLHAMSLEDLIRADRKDVQHLISCLQPQAC